MDHYYIKDEIGIALYWENPFFNKNFREKSCALSQPKSDNLSSRTVTKILKVVLKLWMEILLWFYLVVDLVIFSKFFSFVKGSLDIQVNKAFGAFNKI